MVDGVSAAELLTVLFDSADASPAQPEPWQPDPAPSTARLLTTAIGDAIVNPLGRIWSLPGLARTQIPTGLGPGAIVRLATSLMPLRDRSFSSLNGAIGTHRRWSWAEADLKDVKAVREALGGTVNDVVLAAITQGFRELLLSRGETVDDRVVRTLVPVSMRSESERGTPNNRVAGFFAGLPVGLADPALRLAAIRQQMERLKTSGQSVAADVLTRMSGFSPAMLLSLASQLVARTPQWLVQTVTTNVPGPRQPIHMLGRRVLYSYPYVPVQGSVRISIAIFSYDGRLFFGITGDYDSVPDIDVLRSGIENGMAGLLASAQKPPTSKRRTRPAPLSRTAARRRVPHGTRG
jgi:WS/DGAT/MGAT family acyltransferase